MLFLQMQIYAVYKYTVNNYFHICKYISVNTNIYRNIVQIYV